MRSIVLLSVLLLACGEPAATDAGVSPADGGSDAGVPDVDAGTDVDAGSPAWRPETPTPTPIQEIAVEAHAGEIWIAGGFDALGAIVTSVRRYDPGGGAWSDGPDLPAPRHHMSLVSHGGDLYALGGMQTVAFEPLDTAWVLRSGSTAWEPIATMPRDRGAAAADSVGDVIVMAGGNESRGGLASETLIYDPAMDAWRFGAPLPTEREHLAAVGIDGELFVFAGRRNSLGSTRTELEIYDPVADTWRAGAELPYPRGGFDAALLAGGVYAIGGEEPAQVLDTVDRYDVATDTWSPAPATESPHHGHGVADAGRSHLRRRRRRHSRVRRNRRGGVLRALTERPRFGDTCS